MSNCDKWVLYNVLTEESIGIWTDYSSCEEFMYHNQEDYEIWTIFPADELFTIQA